MALSWSIRRKGLYSTVTLAVIAILLLIIYEAFFTSAPTCFDHTQNGDEHGVDCGGSCSLICSNEAHAPVVSWSRAFEVSPGVYTAAAYIQNSNPGAASKNVPYSFDLFDADNNLVLEQQGDVTFPPMQTVPLIVPNVSVGNRVVVRVLLSFGVTPVWQKIASTTLPTLRVSQQNLSPDGATLSVVVSNDSLIDAPKTTIGAVLFDSSGTAIAASKSIVSIPKRSSQSVVFTWPDGNPEAVRAEVTALPSL